METIHSLPHLEINLVKELLQESGLPVADLDEAAIQFFGIKENHKVVACGALEIYNSNAVLRSVAVRQTHQNQDYGKQIVRFLEKKARELGVGKLFLLTTTAENFFRKLEYISIQRDSCPPEIVSSAQFKDICPDSAICLYKNLLP